MTNLFAECDGTDSRVICNYKCKMSHEQFTKLSDSFLHEILYAKKISGNYPEKIISKDYTAIKQSEDNEKEIERLRKIAHYRNINFPCLKQKCFYLAFQGEKTTYFIHSNCLLQ